MALAVTVVLVIAGSVYLILSSFRKTGDSSRTPVCVDKVLGLCHEFSSTSKDTSSRGVEDVPGTAYSLRVYYGSQTGTGKLFAEQLASAAVARGIETGVFDLKDSDPEDTLTQEVRKMSGSLLFHVDRYIVAVLQWELCECVFCFHLH